MSRFSTTKGRMRRRTPVAVFSLTILAAMVTAPSHALAWSNGGYSADLENPDYGTHDWIADMALEMQTVDVSFLEGTYHADYLVGTEAPDNPEFIGDTVNHHVYYFSSGDLQDDASAERAQAMFDSAFARLEAGEFSVAAYYIGAMTHYVADVGVFGHTMGAYTDWGAEVHHSDYEEEFEDRLSSLSPPSGLTLENMTAYDAALELARDVTFGKGDIMPNIWMDVNYDWSDGVFEDSAMASLHAAVSAAAGAINNLMRETRYDDPEEPEPSEPTAPTDLEAYLEDGKVVITWATPAYDGGEAIVDYIVYRGNSTDSRAEVATVSSLTLTWTDDVVESGKSYYYGVAARNSVGTGDLSAAVSITVPSEDGPDILLGVLVSALAAALASGGAFAYRRTRKRGRG